MAQAQRQHRGSALIIFAKVPQPGQVKTRLTPHLTPEAAATLYDAFLRDALDQYLTLDVDLRLYLSPPVDALPPDLAPAGISLHIQQGPDLGKRMQFAFLEGFAAGYERQVIIGTDHPTLPTAFIAQAFAQLSRPRNVVIGPSEDGGYYLLGMNDFYPQLFEGMTYSHPSVFDQTLQRAGRVNGMLNLLPPWYDVDTPEALDRLLADLDDPAVEAGRTRKVLHDMGLYHEA